MPRLVSWPMYAVDPDAVARFAAGVRRALADAGLADVPDVLTMPDDLASHWRDPALLLSQTCGFPLVTSLAGRVRYVATPCFAAPGCAGARYSSAVVVRRDDPAMSVAGLRGRRAAFNARDSQSGYNALRALAAPHATGGRFFAEAVATGSHRASAGAVASGAADVAAIDAVTLALLSDHAPGEVAPLRVLCHTAPTPGLPLVTAAGTSEADVARLRRAMAEACRGDTAAARALRLDGTMVLPEHSYAIILHQRDAAVAAGYPELA